jgi:Flp pilus assembly pilin Flp
MRFPFVQSIARRRRQPARGKDGQTLVEYALILAIIAIVCLAAFSVLGHRLIQIFSTITTLLDTAQASH